MFILILTYKVQFNWDLNSVNLFYLQVSKTLEVVNRYCETIFLGLLDDALFQCSCLKVIEGYVCWSFRLPLASRKFADKRLLMPVWLNEPKLLAGSGTRFHWFFLVNFSCFFSLVFTGFLDWIVLILTWFENRFPLYKLDDKGLGQTSNFSWEVPSWKGRRLAQLSSSELVCRAVIKRRGGGGIFPATLNVAPVSFHWKIEEK